MQQEQYSSSPNPTIDRIFQTVNRTETGTRVLVQRSINQDHKLDFVQYMSSTNRPEPRHWYQNHLEIDNQRIDKYLQSVQGILRYIFRCPNQVRGYSDSFLSTTISLHLTPCVPLRSGRGVCHTKRVNRNRLSSISADHEVILRGLQTPCQVPIVLRKTIDRLSDRVRLLPCTLQKLATFRFRPQFFLADLLPKTRDFMAYLIQIKLMVPSQRLAP